MFPQLGQYSVISWPTENEEREISRLESLHKIFDAEVPWQRSKIFVESLSREESQRIRKVSKNALSVKKVFAASV